MTNRWAIGDIHGQYEKLVNALNAIESYQGNDEDYEIIYLGDFSDRGPDSKGVHDLLRMRMKKDPKRNKPIKGNHDFMLEKCFSAHSKTRKSHMEMFLRHGGVQTLASYGIIANEIPGIAVKMSGVIIEDSLAIAKVFPEDVIEWIKELPYSYEDNYRFYVHAGVYPDIPLDRQVREVMMWVREEFLMSKFNWGKLIVHGHTPTEDAYPDFSPNQIGIDTGGYVDSRPICAMLFTDDQRYPKLYFLVNVDGVTSHVCPQESETEHYIVRQMRKGYRGIIM